MPPTPVAGDAGSDREMFFKMGGAYDYTTREYRADNFAYAYGSVGRLPLPDVFVPDNDVALTGGDQLPEEDIDPTGAGSRDPTFIFRNGATEVYEASQTIVAGYGSFQAR